MTSTPPSSGRPNPSLAQARARLEAALAHAATGGSAGATRRVVSQPAIGLAATPDAPAIVFVCAGARYAVPAERVVEVVQMQPLTPLPGVATFVVGARAVRGDVLTVLDLRTLFGASAAPEAEGEPRLLVVRAGNARVALAVDAIEAFTSVVPAQRHPVDVAPGAGAARYVAGRTADAVRILDVEALVTDPALVVSRNP